MVTFNEGVRESLADKMKPFVSALVNLFEERMDLLIYCGYRSGKQQNNLFCSTRNQTEIDSRANLLRMQGFPKLADYLLTFPVGDASKANVTNATAGESLHNYGLAIDAVPTQFSKPVWDNSRLYADYGAGATTVGLEWAGNWTVFREMPHSQIPQHPMALVRAELMPTYSIGAST